MTKTNLEPTDNGTKPKPHKKSKSKISRAKNFCFTYNNYTDKCLSRLQNLDLKAHGVQYLIFGKEQASTTGTEHLQGFVQFQSRRTLNQIKKIIGDCHYSVSRSLDASIEYCKKEGDFFEYGDFKGGTQGKRSDLEEFKAEVKLGLRDRKTLREEHSEVAARFPKFFNDYISDHLPKPEFPQHELRQWQVDLEALLDKTPDDRQITFVVDHKGNEGKSWFAHYYEQKHDNVQVMVPGKKADMAYTLIDEPHCLIVDAPRSKQGEFVQYDFLEEVKNGYVFSPKYESRVKHFRAPHVVCMMNEYPDMTKLSEDRYNIIVLNEGTNMLIN